MRKKYYCGYKTIPLRLEVFTHDNIPTLESHGHIYKAVIGPFRTKMGAEFMATYGLNNPHCLHVDQAERLARVYKVVRTILP